MSARTQRTNHSSANAAVAAVALTAGLSPAELGRICELPFVDLFSSRRLSERVVYAIITWLERSHPERAIGLELAKQVPLSLLGPVEEAARYASDVRELVELAVEHASVLSMGLELELELGLEESALRMSHALDEHGGSIGPELAFGAVTRLLDELIGSEGAIERVEFAHAARGSQEAYIALFDAPVCFGAEANRLVVRTAMLERRLPSAAPDQMQLLRRRLERVASELDGGAPSGLARVREAIERNAEHAEFSATAAARRLGMSLRAMQRLVRRHGKSVRELLEEARRARAEQLLRDDSLSVAQVADLLDYSTEGAFRRAFKRWRGHSPAAHRRAQREPASGLHGGRARA